MKFACLHIKSRPEQYRRFVNFSLYEVKCNFRERAIPGNAFWNVTAKVEFFVSPSRAITRFEFFPSFAKAVP